eukprot:TRINITY_DN12526_c0_g2_i4.p1 TRINITY_DN12526_c0_g2~~TRINITY_DN12526_c0_g2_i4.p1  ORF type:complete len:230 (-),score=3.47 TRINITY_DN12526_c0_g2_i4:39-728(-)
MSIVLTLIFLVYTGYAFVNPGLIPPADAKKPAPLILQSASSLKFNITVLDLSFVISTDKGLFNETYADSVSVASDMNGRLRFHFKLPKLDDTASTINYAMSRNLHEGSYEVEQDGSFIEVVISVIELKKSGLFPAWIEEEGVYYLRIKTNSLQYLHVTISRSAHHIPRPVQRQRITPPRCGFKIKLWSTIICILNSACSGNYSIDHYKICVPHTSGTYIPRHCKLFVIS